MKTILKAGSLLAMVAVLGSSCSVERKTKSGKKNVIDVGMNKTEKQNSQATAYASYAYQAAATGK